MLILNYSFCITFLFCYLRKEVASQNVTWHFILLSCPTSIRWVINIHLIQKGCLLNCCIMHYALCIAHCCMPRPQRIVVHIASIVNTRMSLSHSRNLQCYLKIVYIHGALRSGYATMRNAQCAMHNAQCNNSKDNVFWIRFKHIWIYIGLFGGTRRGIYIR